MFVAIYRWRIRPLKDEVFIREWLDISQRMKMTEGCLGARLHRHEDGTFIAYAQWSNRDAMHKARDKIGQELFEKIQEECIESYMPFGQMQIIADLLDVGVNTGNTSNRA